MAIRDVLPDCGQWDIQILATDVSDAAIAKASRGRYARHEIERGLSEAALTRYFVQDGDEWVVDVRIRSMVSFRRFNLSDPYTSFGKFDIVFCRNVAIYFTPEMRKSVFRRIAANTNVYGYLFVGSAESLADIGPEFQPLHHCRSVFYQPNLASVGR